MTNFIGLFIGAGALLIIGLGFPLVILGERHFGFLWWPYMMGIGALFLMGSLFIANIWLSAFTGVTGAVFIWGSTELPEQSRRVQAGWFLQHPRKLAPPFEAVIKRWKAPRL